MLSTKQSISRITNLMVNQVANKKPVHSFEKDNKFGNRAGAPAGKRIQKSKLRKLEDELMRMQPKALENIEKSINGAEIDSEQLASSKWLVGSVITVSKAAHSEEIGYTKLRKELADAAKEDDEQTPEQISQDAPKRLSLVYQAPEDEE